MRLKVCPKKTCPGYHQRFRLEVCVCGSPMQAIRPCCDQETVQDHGFCGSCGTSKRIVYLDEVSHG